MLISVGIFILAWYFGKAVCFEIFAAALFATLEFSLLVAVGLLFYSIGTNFTLNSLLLIAVYIAGHSTREAVISFAGLGKYGSKLHLYIVKTISIILPDFDFFNFRLELLHHTNIPAQKIIITIGYWAFYLIALLVISSAIFKNRDI